MEAIRHGKSSLRLIHFTIVASELSNFFLELILGDVNEVQSLIDRGVQLNYENSLPLHDSITLHLVDSTFWIETNCNKLFVSYENDLKPAYLFVVWVDVLFLEFNENVFKLLIKNGADLEAVDNLQRTPL